MTLPRRLIASVALAILTTTTMTWGAAAPAGAVPPVDPPQPWHLPLRLYADAPVHATLPAGARARAATAVGVSPTSGSQETRFLGTGTGFTPGSSVRIAVTRPDGAAYTGSYPHTKTAASDGSFAWSWIWGSGDPLGTYTYTATDVSGTVVHTTFTITSGTGTPPAPAGSQLMFDAASAPSLATMKAWLASPYRTVGVYVPVEPGTDDRHDKVQSNLTASWVAEVTALGWHVLPIYLGVQAPEACQGHDFWHLSGTPATARTQGAQAAAYAARSVAALGISTSIPVFYDMEPYGSGCSAPLQAFFDGWTTGLHDAGLRAGAYGTQITVMKDLAARLDDPTFHEPDAVWVATDSRTTTTTGFSAPPDGSFVAERANQFRLGVTRTYGGVSINIDESVINTGVLTGTPPTPMPTATTRALAPVTTTGRVTARWSGTAPPDATLTSYDVRTRVGTTRTRLGAWRVRSAVPSTTRSLAARVAPGRTWCLGVRAHDSAGRVSAWSAPVCSSRPVDDRALTARGWLRQKAAAADSRTLTSTGRRGVALRLKAVRSGHVAVVVRGATRNRLRVTLGGRLLGTTPATRGPGRHVLWLPARAARTGTLVLTTTRTGAIRVDGLLTVASG
ncbi:hypothetical protein ASC77_18850 [Nocardioides sp. Root1257]|uniref:DUF1906 domain-containing protein n=1 Tax=unclassified Nocardioides TaxID=2615069 RepID=UPI0006FC2372|nr:MULTISPECIES: DUF1906 domain-containing protein [unclassified Nocardioides]KQW45968.1 hypothetical protein ASC77_18850 [Nocardioides sp. Root1257]KRC43232.1 hypothetical protein ASE24_19815 [Nocardioides sp. Root224]